MNFKSIFTFFIALILSYNTFAQSDAKAVEIAHKVMENMGGVENWNNVHYLKWDFGKRVLHWNKWTGDVRVTSPKDELVILVNINTNKGKAFKNGVLVTDAKETTQLLNQAKKWWINDSYWLTMPWKLLDPGVTLKLLEKTTLENGHKAAVLQMTFENVGVTPNNKYHVYVDAEDNLVKQWSFFSKFSDEKPKFTKPWDNYQELNKVLLSFDRSDFGPKNVIAKQEFDARLFTDL